MLYDTLFTSEMIYDTIFSSHHAKNKGFGDFEKMKKILILLLLLALIAGLAACDNNADSEATGGTITGALQRVEYGDNVAYLFGTMHSGQTYWFPLADYVEDALRRSDVIALEYEEIGTGNKGAAAMWEANRRAGWIPDGLLLDEYISEEAYNHYIEVINTWNFSARVNPMLTNPVHLIDRLELDLLYDLSEMDEALWISVDTYIANVANELGLKIIGLESLQHFMDILYDLPYEARNARVMSFPPQEEMIKTYNTPPTLDDLADYYRNNDFDMLNNMFLATEGIDIDCQYITYLREVILNGRSIVYANEIMRLLRETEEPTTFFVAVGLSHIIRSGAGEEFTDIVQQLRLAGFTVTPIWQ